MLAGISVTYDAPTNEVRIVWSDVTWPSSTITARGFVIYKSRGGVASADELVAFGVNDVDVSSTDGTFTLDLPAVPLKLTVAA